MKLRYIIVTLPLLLGGCTTISADVKKDIGDYVSAAVVQSVEKKLDDKLATKGLSIAEITSMLSLNLSGNGKVATADTYTAIKEIAGDVALAEVKKIVDEKVAEARKDSDEKHSSIWHYFIGLVGSGLSALIAKHLHDNSKFKKIEDAIEGNEDEAQKLAKKAKKPPEPPLAEPV